MLEEKQARQQINRFSAQFSKASKVEKQKKFLGVIYNSGKFAKEYNSKKRPIRPDKFCETLVGEIGQKIERKLLFQNI